MAGAATDNRIPSRITADTTPTRDRTLPYHFTTRGELSFKSGREFCPKGTDNKNYCVPVTRKNACSGVVSIQFFFRKDTVSRRTTHVHRDCRYESSVSFGSRHRPYFTQSGRNGSDMTVKVRFEGNQFLKPSQAPDRHVRGG